jgi:hypothetical protein
MREDMILSPSDWYAEKRKYTFTERKMPSIKGMWFDTFRYTDGRVLPGPSGSFEWKDNQIQNTFSKLLACWARAESGYDRINYFAVGSGLVSWDTTPPTQSYNQTTLTTEYFRKAVPQADIIFIDPVTNLPTGGTPSRKLEITCTLSTSEGNGTLREFGLFGGTATGTLDSGEMVNWIVHYRIDKDSSLEIQRKVRLEFQAL